WAVAVTDAYGSQWRLLTARGEGSFRVTRDGRDAGEFPAAAPGEAARGFRALAGAPAGDGPGRGATPPPAPEAGTQITADVLRDLAARHGLAAARGDDDKEIVVRAGLPSARTALSLDAGTLNDANGRIIPDALAGVYLAAYAANPRADPDLLYAQAVTGTVPGAAGGVELGERAFPQSLYLHARDDAAARARDGWSTWYVYGDGRDYVSAAQPPAP